MSETTDIRVSSRETPGEQIRLRECLPSASAERQAPPVLFVHGATYPGAMFDTPGASWLQTMADAGRAAYAIDIRGYGGSTRPACMDGPPMAEPAFAQAESAAADIADAVAAILSRRQTDQLDIVGWSWGTLTSGLYTSQAPDSVRRLVLLAPVYAAHNPHWLAQLADPDDSSRMRQVGAYRSQTQADVDARWASQIKADQPSAWRDEALMQAWVALMLADEPGDVVRAPNGVLEDLWEVFNGRPRYDASAIQVPTLVIRGSDDPESTREDALGLFETLGSEYKLYSEIGQATHFLPLEHRRHALHAQVAAFLDSVCP